MKTVGIVGCGSLGAIVARGAAGRLRDQYRLVGLCDARFDLAHELGAELGCPTFAQIGELLALKPDYIVEAAGCGALMSFAIDALESGCDLVVLSVGAFADNEFYKNVEQTATRLGRKIHVPSGAIGGFDVIRSAVWQGGLLSASITNAKPPVALEGAPFLEGKMLSETAQEVIFEGSAREAISAFPKNVNVAVALAIASLGVDDTHVKVVSVPGLALNTHTIELEGAFGRATLDIASTPSDNAGSSALAAHSVLARLENLSRAIQF